MSLTPMFIKYTAELVIRTALLITALYLFFTDPDALDIVTRFGPANELDFVDIAFVLLFVDMTTKLLPHAKIAIGSKKQWHEFHRPTIRTVSRSINDILQQIQQNSLLSINDDSLPDVSTSPTPLPVSSEDTDNHNTEETNAPTPSSSTPSSVPNSPQSQSRSVFNLSNISWLANLPKQVVNSIEHLFMQYIARPAEETAKGVEELSKQVSRQLSVLSGKIIDKELLTADEQLRDSIRESRIREIIPVIVFWVLFNALIAMILLYFGLLTPPVCLLWTLLYFVSDMICVVAWCPFQVLLMRNRCCTTCQIFNWDAIMAATPLIFAPCPFSLILIALALVVLARWEIAFIRNPERFDERTNASLSCANCKDRLCAIRRPIRERKHSDLAIDTRDMVELSDK